MADFDDSFCLISVHINISTIEICCVTAVNITSRDYSEPPSDIVRANRKFYKEDT